MLALSPAGRLLQVPPCARRRVQAACLTLLQRQRTEAARSHGHHSATSRACLQLPCRRGARALPSLPHMQAARAAKAAMLLLQVPSHAGPATHQQTGERQCWSEDRQPNPRTRPGAEQQVRHWLIQKARLYLLISSHVTRTYLMVQPRRQHNNQTCCKSHALHQQL